jgi:hypothetical protein
MKFHISDNFADSGPCQTDFVGDLLLCAALEVELQNMKFHISDNFRDSALFSPYLIGYLLGHFIATFL